MNLERTESVQVVLPPDLERFVAAKVASGEYPAPTLVIHAALQELSKRITRAKSARTGDLLLPRKLNEFINEKITSGHHKAATDVICEALRLLDKPFRFADEAATEGPGR